MAVVVTVTPRVHRPLPRKEASADEQRSNLLWSSQMASTQKMRAPLWVRHHSQVTTIVAAKRCHCLLAAVRVHRIRGGGGACLVYVAHSYLPARIERTQHALVVVVEAACQSELSLLMISVRSAPSPWEHQTPNTLFSMPRNISALLFSIRTLLK